MYMLGLFVSGLLFLSMLFDVPYRRMENTDNDDGILRHCVIILYPLILGANTLYPLILGANT